MSSRAAASLLAGATLTAGIALGCDLDPEAGSVGRKTVSDEPAAVRSDSTPGGGAPAAAELPSVPREARRANVESVTDGDTVVLSGLGPTRLIGIDTPEVFGGAECYGSEASAFAKRSLPPGSSVRYVYGRERTDRYDRDLVYLWLVDGRFFNGLLVLRGYAAALTIAPNVEHAGLFARLAGRARERGLGLWAAGCAGNDGRRGGSVSRARGPSTGGRGTRGRAPGSRRHAGGGDRDCSDFASERDAQRHFESKGGPRADPDSLDSDRDGRACESLP